MIKPASMMKKAEKTQRGAMWRRERRLALMRTLILYDYRLSWQTEYIELRRRTKQIETPIIQNMENTETQSIGLQTIPCRQQAELKARPKTHHWYSNFSYLSNFQQFLYFLTINIIANKAPQTKKGSKYVLAILSVAQDSRQGLGVYQDKSERVCDSDSLRKGRSGIENPQQQFKYYGKRGYMANEPVLKAIK